MKLLIKLGGRVLEDTEVRFSLARQLAELFHRRVRLLIVHGGGGQLSELCRALSIPVCQIQGRRLTDARTLEAAKMVFSGINRDLTATLLAAGVPAVGISCFDGGLVKARRRPPMPMVLEGANGRKELQSVDFGLVGEITQANPLLVETLWNSGFVPAVSCLCCDEQGQILNINADTVAGELAIALAADRLISVADVDGLYLDAQDASTRIARLTLEEARDYLQKGVFIRGMAPKVETAIRALEQGLNSFQVLSGIKPDHLLKGLHEEAGTVIFRPA